MRTHILTRAALAMTILAVSPLVFAQTPEDSKAPAAATAQPKASTKALHKAASKPQAWTQVGTASWYGNHFHGHTTSDGEVYDMYRLTCAHRNLPIGSWVKVTNLHNHKWVVLRVNDRGPFVDDRIIDLSFAAAQMLEIAGLARVKLELLPPDQQIAPTQATTLAQLASPTRPAQ